MESKYQETGPKGPLWEDISAGMHRLGYKRNPKRCKEKWENINKYFKKVKESNKKRPEDAKTCPYFHELDALYRKKVLVGQTSGAIEIRSDAPTNVAVAAADPELPKEGGPEEEEETGSAEKPEDTVNEMNHPSERQQLGAVDLGGKADEGDDDNLDQDENEDELDEDEDEDEDMEEESKMAYKIEYQQPRQNSGTPNGGGGGESAPPFVTMVQ